MRRLGSLVSAAVRRLSALAHRHTLRVWLLWGCGVLVFMALPISLIDPAALMLLLDPELLALIVVSAAGLVRARLALAAPRKDDSGSPGAGLWRAERAQVGCTPCHPDWRGRTRARLSACARSMSRR
jgi:hypothetical protein